jgi:acyl-CoA synthetase (NDP forming)
MSKMSEMAETIEELRTAASAINNVANWLAEVLSGSAVQEVTVSEEPAPTKEQVRAILSQKSRMGYTAEIRSLLQKYGANTLSGIDPTHYKSLLADAEVFPDVE